MAKPGPKPAGKVDLNWSPQFAYAIGLLTTDGCLSSDGRHIDLTSKDREQIENFMKCLSINDVKIGQKSGSGDGPYWRVQFGDVLFYQFLKDIGLMPRKSKKLKQVEVPEDYFFDFLRGHFDGDGHFYSFWDERWKNSYMFYTVFSSSSLRHLQWIEQEIANRIGDKGNLQVREGNTHQLRYAKTSSIKLLKKLYFDPESVCLSRKRLKVVDALGIIDEHLLK